MKGIKLFILQFFVLIGLQDTCAINGLWLQKKDGKTIGYLFENDISISYSRTSFIIHTSDASVEHSYEDINKVYFDDNVITIIEKMQKDEQQKISITAHEIEINGFERAIPVMITDLLGRLIISRATDANGSLLISRTDFPRGIYVVRVGQTAIKFNNK